MRLNSKPLRAAIVTGLLFFLSGCATMYNPATQRNEMVLIDTKSEVALGQDMDSQIRIQLKIIEDPQRQARLNVIGGKVASFSDRPDLVYHFRIVDDKDLNAFTIPGGFVYVNLGLMDSASDDELACVLGHEIGHVAARHSVKRLQAQMGYQLVMGIALGASDSSAIGDAIGIVFNLVNLGYGRKDEFLADKLAVKYAYRAGFDPHGMATFFEKLKQEAKARGENSSLVFLSSHPPIDQRIEKVKTEIGLIPSS